MVHYEVDKLRLWVSWYLSVSCFHPLQISFTISVKVIYQQGYTWPSAEGQFSCRMSFHTKDILQKRRRVTMLSNRFSCVYFLVTQDNVFDANWCLFIVNKLIFVNFDKWPSMNLLNWLFCYLYLLYQSWSGIFFNSVIL